MPLAQPAWPNAKVGCAAIVRHAELCSIAAVQRKALGQISRHHTAQRQRSQRLQQASESRSAATMGEKMGPNTIAAFHAGADFMQAKLEAEDESSDDEALLAGAPLESYGQARMAELRKQQERRNKPPGAVLVDPTAWRRLVVDASSDRWILVSLDHPPNPKCEATLEALENIPISRRGGCELRRVEAKFCVPEEKLGSLPAIFGYCGGELRARLIGRELLDSNGEAPSCELLVEKLVELGVIPGDAPADEGDYSD